MAFVTACVLMFVFQPPGDVAKSTDAIARLQDKDAKVRVKAVETLAAVGADLEPRAIAALAKITDDPDAKVRRVVTQSLGEIGPRAREWGGGPKLGASLIRLFQDKDSIVRRAAVWSFGQVGVDTPEEIQALAAMLKDPTPELRGMVIVSLAQYIHAEATPEWRLMVLDAIADGLADKDARVQRLAGEALLLSRAESIPSLSRILENGKGNSRLWAALVLGEIGPAAREAAPLLQKALGEVPKEGKTVIQQALKKIQS